MSYQNYQHMRWCMSCAKYKPPGGPQARVWRCADCRKAIAERNAKAAKV